MRYLKNKEMGGAPRPNFQDIPVTAKSVDNPNEHAKKRGRAAGNAHSPTNGDKRKQQYAKAREHRATLSRRLGLKKG